MERFEMNFKNKRVKVWFMGMLPLGLLAIFLYIFLPADQQIIPTLLLLSGLIIYYSWVFFHERKRSKQ